MRLSPPETQWSSQSVAAVFHDKVVNRLNIGLAASVGPHVASWADEALEAHPWGVDRAVACEEEHIVKPATKGAAEEWSNHRNLTVSLVQQQNRFI